MVTVMLVYDRNTRVILVDNGRIQSADNVWMWLPASCCLQIIPFTIGWSLILLFSTHWHCPWCTEHGCIQAENKQTGSVPRSKVLLDGIHRGKTAFLIDVRDISHSKKPLFLISFAIGVGFQKQTGAYLQTDWSCYDETGKKGASGTSNINWRRF